MARYHAVDGSALERSLAGEGYERRVQGNEVVYVLRSRRNNAVVIKVYTSIRAGAARVRARGADAIRVCVVYDNGQKSFGIGKFPKVLRTTSDVAVLKRLGERLQQARARAIAWMDRHPHGGRNIDWDLEADNAEREMNRDR